MRWKYDSEVDITEMIGKTFISIDRSNEYIIFNCSDGSYFDMSHSQDCCESVMVESITGDLNDLINSPILFAEERTSEENPEDVCKDIIEYQGWGSFTWTFYTIRTAKGTVDIRWYGESNGYYSESVEIYYLNKQLPS